MKDTEDNLLLWVDYESHYNVTDITIKLFSFYSYKEEGSEEMTQEILKVYIKQFLNV